MVKKPQSLVWTALAVSLLASSGQSTQGPRPLRPTEILQTLRAVSTERSMWRSSLNRGVWLDFAPGVAIIGRPSKSSGLPSSHRVRVTGILFARAGASYDHLGAYHFELMATRAEYPDGGR